MKIQWMKILKIQPSFTPVSEERPKTFPNSEDDVYKALHAESFFFYKQKNYVTSDFKRR
jgi:hypothetical protein